MSVNNLDRRMIMRDAAPFFAFPSITIMPMYCRYFSKAFVSTDAIS